LAVLRHWLASRQPIPHQKSAINPDKLGVNDRSYRFGFSSTLAILAAWRELLDLNSNDQLELPQRGLNSPLQLPQRGLGMDKAQCLAHLGSNVANLDFLPFFQA